jgi:hypothetical protein
VKACVSCGNDLTPIRVDGQCFRCHVRGIGFTYRGGGGDGRQNWGRTEREFIREHVGEDNIRNGTVERVG